MVTSPASGQHCDNDPALCSPCSSSASPGSNSTRHLVISEPETERSRRDVPLSPATVAGPAPVSWTRKKPWAWQSSNARLSA